MCVHAQVFMCNYVPTKVSGHLVGLGSCLSSFAVAIIRHHDKDNLEKKEFIWSLLFERIRVHDHHGGSHISR